MSNRTLVAAIVAIIGLTGALVLAMAILVSRPPPPPMRIAMRFETPTPTRLSPTPAPLTVYVSGAVANPGVYAVRSGQRVEDTIRLAGGLAEDADLDRVNLALPLKDGLQVHVPRRPPAGAAAP